MCYLESNKAVFVVEIMVSCFSRGSHEWNSVLEIYVLHLPVMLEMLHD